MHCAFIMCIVLAEKKYSTFLYCIQITGYNLLSFFLHIFELTARVCVVAPLMGKEVLYNKNAFFKHILRKKEARRESYKYTINIKAFKKKKTEARTHTL